MQEVTDLISNIGFPIFVALYLLLKLEPTMKEVSKINLQLLEYLRQRNGDK